MHDTFLRLTDLNVDCLLLIFEYCSEGDLLCLCLASRRLEDIIDRHIFYPLTLDLLLCGNRDRPSIEKRFVYPHLHGI